jgi:hypothetical protein
VESVKNWQARRERNLPIKNAGFFMLSNAAAKAFICVISRVVRNCSASLVPASSQKLISRSYTIFASDGLLRLTTAGRNGGRLLGGQGCAVPRRSATGHGTIGAPPAWCLSKVVRGFRHAHEKARNYNRDAYRARQAERGPSVLLLLTVSLIAVMIGMAAVWYIFFRT